MGNMYKAVKFYSIELSSTPLIEKIPIPGTHEAIPPLKEHKKTVPFV